MSKSGDSQPIPNSPPDRTHWKVDVLFPAAEFVPLMGTEATRDWKSEYESTHVPDISRQSVIFTQTKTLAGVGLLWETLYGRFDRDNALVRTGMYVRYLLDRNGADGLDCSVVQLQTTDLRPGEQYGDERVADVTASYLPIDAKLQHFREISPEDFL